MISLIALLFTAAVVSDDATVVAYVNGTPITEVTVDNAARQDLDRLRAREYEIRRDAVEKLVDKMLLERAAKAENVTVDELLARHVDALVTPVTAEELDNAYQTLRGPLKALPEAEGRAKLFALMRSGRIERLRKQYLSTLRAAADVDVVLQPTRVSLPGGAATQGPERAPVTISEFADVECPSCARFASEIEHIVERHAPDVRLVFHHFPLDMHPHAAKAAEALNCAGEQKSFWPMETRLFAQQQALGVDDLKTHARELKLDLAAFTDCLASGRAAAMVRSDVEAGRAAGVVGTPTVFVNGILLASPTPEIVERTITDELARARRASKMSR